MKINVRKGIQIDIRSDKSMYITIGDYTYYIDDSTGEQVIDHWKTNSPSQDVIDNDIPQNPHQVYDEWISWADFLGINNK